MNLRRPAEAAPDGDQWRAHDCSRPMMICALFSLLRIFLKVIYEGFEFVRLSGHMLAI
jgi:hypothetical protein